MWCWVTWARWALRGRHSTKRSGPTRARGVDAVLATGERARHTVDAFGPGAQHFASAEDLIEHGVPAIAPAATVLVKGSRFMRMERIVEALVLKDPVADLPTGSSTQQQH